MKKYENSVKALYLQIALVIINIIIISFLPLDFDSGGENYLAVLESVVYIVSGVVFISEQNALKSLCPFAIGFIAVSVLLSIGESSQIFLLFVNPSGIVLLISLCDLLGIEISAEIIYWVAAIFPMLFLYIGVLFKRLFVCLRVKK